MCTYLAKRGSVYYFRRIIPAELRAALGGKAEFMLSLRTKDREQAKRLIPDKTKLTDRLIDEARKQSVVRADLKIRPSSAPAMSEFELEQALWAAHDEAEREDRREGREALLPRLEDALALSTAEMTPREARLRDMLRDAHLDLTIEQERQLAERVRRAEERRGVGALAPLNLPSQRPQATLAAQAEQNPGVMLDPTILDLWAAERKVSAKGKYDHRSAVRWLYHRVGEKPVAEITRQDMLAFKNKLIEEGQSASNTRQKLSRLRTVLKWARDNDYIATNPAEGIAVLNTDAAKDKRKSFDVGSLNSIFSSPVYSEGLRPTQGRGEAAYWLPLLALFTGARLEELGQLRPMDVQQERYPDENGEERPGWFIHIREDEADDLKLKNAASERTVPVHAELERLGFIKYAEAAKEAGQARLFPLLKPNKFGRLTAKWGEWFSPYLRKTVGVTDKRMVFHSFRHTFKDYARHAGIIEGVQRQIRGHSSGDVADDYGSGYSLHQLVEGMRLYKVPGIKLPN